MRAGTCRAAEPSPEQASGPGHVSAFLVAVSSLFAAPPAPHYLSLTECCAITANRKEHSIILVKKMVYAFKNSQMLTLCAL